MSEQNHIGEEQLRLLAIGDTDDQHLQEVADHVESCSQCRKTLDSMAAKPELWNMASQLISQQSILDMAKRGGQLQPDVAPDKVLDESEEKYSVEHVMDAPSHPEMMGRIGNYDIEREVGRGGMGVVFKAFDTELNRPLAIKILSPRLAGNGTARQRFSREARAAAAVIHPNVVAIYGVNTSHETPYLVMPYVAGPSLQRLIDEHGPLGEKEIVRMALQVAAGLSAAHSQGLVHRDIKPANILVESDVSRVLVTDFGLARAVDDASATQSGCFVGTPNYMSPEQALGKRVDARSDLFSLGSVMYFMATGHMPFRADSPVCVLNRISHDEPTPLQQVNGDVSQMLCGVIGKLLEKNPKHRFQSAGELHVVLERYLAYLHQPDVSEPPVISTVRSRKPFVGLRSTHVAKALLAAVVLASLVGVGFWNGWWTLPVAMQAAMPAGGPADEGKPASKSKEAASGTISLASEFEQPPLKEFVTKKKFEAKPGGLLTVDADIGSIEIETSDRNEVTIEVIRSVAAKDIDKTDEILKRNAIQFSNDEGNVGVRTQLRLLKDEDIKVDGLPLAVTDDVRRALKQVLNQRLRRVRFRISIPRKYNVDLKTNGGNISIPDLSGRVRCKTSGGKLQLGQVTGTVWAKTSGGEVRLDGCGESAELWTSGGSITTGDIHGSILAHTSGGRISLGQVKGTVSANTSGGSIRIASAGGPVEATTSGGAVYVTLSQQPKRDCLFTLSGGSIRIDLARDLALDIDARTEQKANVKAPFELNNNEAQLNGGGTKLVVQAKSGNIRFHYIDTE